MWCRMVGSVYRVITYVTSNILVIIRTCSVHTASAKNSCLTGPLKRPILLVVVFSVTTAPNVKIFFLRQKI